MPKKVFVTGAKGLIGKETLKPLLDKGYEVFALTTGEIPSHHSEVIWLQGNLFDFETVKKIFEEIKPTHLLHLAWQTTGKFNDNINFDFLLASLNLLKTFKENGGEKVVIAGTYIEYAESAELLDEYKSPLNPQHIYGKCKNYLREIAELYCKSNGISLAWGRIFSAFGLESDLRRLTGDVMNSLFNDKTVEIKSGSLIRDYIYSKDVASAFVKILDSDKQGIFNISTGIATSIKDYVLTIAKLMKKENLVVFNEHASNQYKFVVGNNSRLRNDLGWEPEYTIETALKEIIMLGKEKYNVKF